MDRVVVLIVEDESLARLDAVETAEAAGFAAIAAANADEAIKILEGRDDIRIVFTDIDMPGSMNGLRLAQAVRDRWPPVQLVITSGHVAPGLGQMPTGARFISKPYKGPEVVRAFRELAS